MVQKITLKFEGVADGYCTNLFLTNGHSRPERSVHRGLTVRCRRPCLSEQSKSNSSSSWTELKCNSETLNLKSWCFLLLKNWIIYKLSGTPKPPTRTNNQALVLITCKWRKNRSGPKTTSSKFIASLTICTRTS